MLQNIAFGMIAGLPNNFVPISVKLAIFAALTVVIDKVVSSKIFKNVDDHSE
jgi:hypothetical protein